MPKVTPQMNVDGKKHPVLSISDIKQLVTPLVDGSSRTPYMLQRRDFESTLGAANKKPVVAFLTREGLLEALSNEQLSDLLIGRVEGRGKGQKLKDVVTTTVHKTQHGVVRRVHFVDTENTKEVQTDRTARFRDTGSAVGPLLYEFNSGGTILIPAELVNDEEFLRGMGQGIGNSTATSTKTILSQVNTAKQKKPTVDVDKIASVRSKLQSIGVLSDTEVASSELKNAVEKLQEGEGLARAKALTRLLTELPANIMTTSAFVDVVEHVVEVLNNKYGDRLEFQKIGPDLGQSNSDKTTENLNMGLLNAVHQGSTMPGPFMIRVKYRNSEQGKGDKRTVNRVAGKTMIFDDGGRANKLRNAKDMKADMGGGATTLGAMVALVESGLKKDIDFCFAVCANENGNHARRHDDVLLAASGKTVEERNTDAEGREALADVVHVSHNLIKEEGDKVGETLTVATLTGAAVNATGHRYPVIGYDPDKVLSLAKAAGDEGEFADSLTADHTDEVSMKGSVADFANLGDKPTRGAQKAFSFIHAAADTPKNEKPGVLHLDIASSITKEPGHTKDLKTHQFSAGEGVGAVKAWAEKMAV